jgi:hypothetical protein
MANISRVNSGNTPQYTRNQPDNSSEKGNWGVYRAAKAMGVGLMLVFGNVAKAAGAIINPQSKSLDDRSVTHVAVNSHNVNKSHAENFLNNTDTPVIDPIEINNIDDLTDIGPEETKEQQELNQIFDFIESRRVDIIANKAMSFSGKIPDLSSDDFESTKYTSLNDFFDVINETSKKLVTTEDCYPQTSITYQNNKIVVDFLFVSKTDGSVEASTTAELKMHPLFAKFADNFTNNDVAYDLTGNNKSHLFGYNIKIISLVDDVLNGRREINDIKNVARRNTVADIIKKINDPEKNSEQEVNVKSDKKVFEDATVAHMCSGEVKNPQIDKKLLAAINVDASNNFDLDKSISDIDTSIAHSIIDSSDLAVFTENQLPLEAHLNFVFSATQGTLLLDTTGIYICSSKQTIDINDKLAKSTDNDVTKAFKVLSAMSDELNILPMATMDIDDESIRVDGLDMQTIYQNSVKILTDKGVLSQTKQPVEQDQQPVEQEQQQDVQPQSSETSKDHHKNPSDLIKIRLKSSKKNKDEL